MTEEFLADLEEREGIEEEGNIYMKEIDPIFTDEAYGLLEERIFENEKVRKTFEWTFGSDSTEVMKSCREERRIDGNVFGVDRMVMEKLENPEGELDWEKFAEGKYVIATRFNTLDEEMINFFPFWRDGDGDK